MPQMQIESELRMRLARLTRRAATINRDLRVDHDDDAAERVTERENDQVLERLDAVTRKEVEAIRGALGRIERGRYGVCESCGRPIGSVRLQAMPTATLCVSCGTRVPRATDAPQL